MIYCGEFRKNRVEEVGDIATNAPIEVSGTDHKKHTKDTKGIPGTDPQYDVQMRGIGMLLEIATTIGALFGAALATRVSTGTIAIVFGLSLIYSASQSFLTFTARAATFERSGESGNP
jgi:hypothetical protein